MPKETFSHYDSADYLKTPAQIAAYMEAAMEEGADDPAFIAHALGVVARARSMAQLSRDTGITREGLYKALSRDGNPSFATVTKVAGALGLSVTFQVRDGEPLPSATSAEVGAGRQAAPKSGGQSASGKSFKGARRRK